ncbi:serine hydrolase [uncultured Lactobacillus sp.]|uniref:serine hydrolase n=1 Tax=uncultured Lactobacillus sp. TaxID=153152 RepID=UPI00261E0866|nr:serine hydrolase [uncultured Lactobacillus sp.]
MIDKIERIKSLIKQASWKQAIIIRQDQKTIFEENSHVEFKSASLIKLGIALYIKCQRPDTLDDVVILKPNQIVGGAGVINRLSIKRYKIRDLIDLMLCLSDNTATNALLDYYGLEKINAFLQENFDQVQLGRYLMKLGPENLVSCVTIMDIFEQLLAGDDCVTALVKNALKYQQVRNKLVAYVNPKYTSFNKTGELIDIQHDIARFENKDDLIDCCVMNSYDDIANYEQIIEMMAQIGKILTN